MMKLALLLFLTLSQGAKFGDNYKSSVATAISEIVEKYFAKDLTFIRIIGFNGQKDNDYHQTTLINDVLMQCSGNISFAISIIDSNKAWKPQLDASSILMLQSYQDFVQVNAVMRWSNGKSRYKHLIYYPNATLMDLYKTIYKSYDMFYVSFVIENKYELALASIFFFTQQECKRPQPRIINKFSTVRQKWDNESFFPKKFSNFHDCRIVLGIRNVLYGTQIHKAANGTVFVKGYSADILKALARALNFQLVFSIYDPATNKPLNLTLSIDTDMMTSRQSVVSPFVIV